MSTGRIVVSDLPQWAQDVLDKKEFSSANKNNLARRSASRIRAMRLIFNQSKFMVRDAMVLQVAKAFSCDPNVANAYLQGYLTPGQEKWDQMVNFIRVYLGNRIIELKKLDGMTKEQAIEFYYNSIKQELQHGESDWNFLGVDSW